jgi:hypothetical protein
MASCSLLLRQERPNSGPPGASLEEQSGRRERRRRALDDENWNGAAYATAFCRRALGGVFLAIVVAWQCRIDARQCLIDACDVSSVLGLEPDGWDCHMMEPTHEIEHTQTLKIGRDCHNLPLS